MVFKQGACGLRAGRCPLFAFARQVSRNAFVTGIVGARIAGKSRPMKPIVRVLLGRRQGASAVTCSSTPISWGDVGGRSLSGHSRGIGMAARAAASQSWPFDRATSGLESCEERASIQRCVLGTSALELLRSFGGFDCPKPTSARLSTTSQREDQVKGCCWEPSMSQETRCCRLPARIRCQDKLFCDFVDIRPSHSSSMITTTKGSP